MILKFDEYIKINEEKNVSSFKEIKINEHWPTYNLMMKNFTSQKYGYRFLGTIYCDWKKYDAYRADGFLNLFSMRLRKVCDDFGEQYLDVSLEKNKDGSITYEEFEEIISKNVDEVTSCKTNSRKIYYVFFNRKEKYFYFMYVSPMAMVYSDELKVWLRIKTSGEEIVYNEYRKIKEFREKRRKEEELEKQRQDKLYKEYRKCVEILEADVEKNPENYKKVYFSDLPKDIQDSWSNLIESDYVKYKKHINSDPYRDYYNIYVNKRDLSDGYVFETVEDFYKSGYTGD